MKPRIIFHAGFHKTATTSVQAFFRKNSGRISEAVKYIGKDDIREITQHSRRYSAERSTFHLLSFITQFGIFLEANAIGETRTILISSEDLAGHLPPRHGIKDYSAAAEIFGAISDVLTKDYALDEVIFFLGIRDPNAWLESAYWQNVRYTPLTMSLEEYRRAYESAANFDTILDAVRVNIGNARLVHAKIEDCQDAPFGPAQPILNLLNLPPQMLDSLAPIEKLYARRPQELLDAWLEINRRNLPVKECAQLKKKVAAVYEAKKRAKSNA